MIIHINGWPGVGKKTVGSLVASSIGGRFIENHLLHDVAFTCAGYGNSERLPLYEKIRAAAYDVLARKPSSEIFVMTNALSKEDSNELKAWEHVVELAMVRAVPLIPINLTASQDEISRRIVSENRSPKKLKCANELVSMMEKYSILVPNVREYTEICTSNMTALEASNKVVDHVNSVKHSVNVATKNHLVLC